MPHESRYSITVLGTKPESSRKCQSFLNPQTLEKLIIFSKCSIFTWVRPDGEQEDSRRLGRLVVAQNTLWEGEPVVKKSNNQVTMNRRSSSDRRGGPERRKENATVAVERRLGERRAKVPRRRQIDPTTCERDYSGDEIEFMQAMDAYKRSSGRMFPTCSEILEVVRNLGYEKICRAPVVVESAAAEFPIPAPTDVQA
jgi:hypothetical protein